MPVFSQSIGVRGVARASGVRRCVRSGCGAVAARLRRGCGAWPV